MAGAWGCWVWHLCTSDMCWRTSSPVALAPWLFGYDTTQHTVRHRHNWYTLINANCLFPWWKIKPAGTTKHQERSGGRTAVAFWTCPSAVQSAAMTDAASSRPDRIEGT
ncbi:hypothetical protein F5884DRAFT_466405 [Xylogone sp. PMI_703]|nr:hypothetical protein F5884DRAFT_466405 [Xylogone sp. PMI_703]